MAPVGQMQLAMRLLAPRRLFRATACSAAWSTNPRRNLTCSNHRFANPNQRVANAVYQPGVKSYPCPTVPAECTRSPCTCSGDDETKEITEKILKNHRRTWSDAECAKAHTEHGLMTWNNASAPGIHAVRGEGSYFWDSAGKKYLDFNSMAMCLSHGHTIDDRIIDAVVDQMKTLPYAYPGMFVTNVRGRLSKLLADIVPGDINTFMFPGAGTEAIEGALRMARAYTGRHKVLSRYRSYHGHTTAALTLTGDFRRWAGEAHASGGYVKFHDPFPYAFKYGDTDEEIASRALTELVEILKHEGTHNVAAIVVEAITGTNGVLIPPKGYLEGVRAICDQYGIMLICDEVMAGFGRTGKMFGFCHAPSVVPDFVTFAKGVNGAVLPLAGIGMRDPVADFFRTNPHMVGSTYHSHPVTLASGYAALQVFLERNLTQNAAEMGVVMEECYNDLLAKHPSVKQARCVGLFGAFDVQRDRQGTFIGEVNDPMDPAMVAFKKDLYERGLFTMMRGHTVFTNPPLTVTADEVREGFAMLDASLHILDEAMTDA
eukprot:m.212128 g.212128  ORF g.212128 m.212128 type:complete len:544 (+) comp19035_c0_seq2:55-1686(+)